MEAYRPPVKERRVNFFCLSFWEVFKLQWYAFNRSELVNLKRELATNYSILLTEQTADSKICETAAVCKEGNPTGSRKCLFCL